MVLEVPNKSSNILNTFGLSKSHRSGIRARRARLPRPLCCLGSCHLARARGARIEAAAASAIYYCWLQPYSSRVEGSEGWWLQRLESSEKGSLPPSVSPVRSYYDYVVVLRVLVSSRGCVLRRSKFYYYQHDGFKRSTKHHYYYSNVDDDDNYTAKTTAVDQ